MAKQDTDLLLARIRDLIKQSQHRSDFLGFLDEAQAAVCEEHLKYEPGVRTMFWGGYEDAERRMLGAFPDYLEPDVQDFPLTALTFSYREADKLSHRDFLGSFMGLGLQRDAVGDILVGKGRCVAFFRQEIAEYVRQNIVKIGRVGVSVLPGAQQPLPLEREFQNLSGVVASERLDCLVAFVCKLSREKATELIRAGMVMHNHRETLSVSQRVSDGDVLSVRKKGKFIIDQLGPVTSKGRLSVHCRKYL